MQRRLAVAFTGPSNSGKTTLILKVGRFFQEQGWSLAIIKHDPKDKARFDTPHKDSYRFSALGAEVVVASPTRTTYFSHRESTLESIVARLGAFDLLLVEGLKDWPLPRIGVMRQAWEESYLPYCDLLAIDTAHLHPPKDPRIVDFNDIARISAWILTHAKVLA